MLRQGECVIRLTVATLALALAVPAIAVAQAKTDFSGTSNVDTTRSDAPPQGGGRGMGGGSATKLVITQTPAEMTVVVTTGRGETKPTYTPDGSEMKAQVRWRNSPMSNTSRKTVFTKG